MIIGKENITNMRMEIHPLRGEVVGVN